MSFLFATSLWIIIQFVCQVKPNTITAFFLLLKQSTILSFKCIIASNSYIATSESTAKSVCYQLLYVLRWKVDCIAYRQGRFYDPTCNYVSYSNLVTINYGIPWSIRSKEAYNFVGAAM